MNEIQKEMKIGSFFLFNNINRNSEKFRNNSSVFGWYFIIEVDSLF